MSVRVFLAPRDPYRWLTLASVALLAVAAGTAAFGLPPVDLHPPTHWFGVMDPFCGGTRAARYAALGEWGRAWTYNPLGVFTVVGVAGLTLRAAVGLATRRWVSLSVVWSVRGRRAAELVALLLLIALQARQQSRADLLMAGTWTLV